MTDAMVPRPNWGQVAREFHEASPPMQAQVFHCVVCLQSEFAPQPPDVLVMVNGYTYCMEHKPAILVDRSQE